MFLLLLMLLFQFPFASFLALSLTTVVQCHHLGLPTRSLVLPGASEKDGSSLVHFLIVGATVTGAGAHYVRCFHCSGFWGRVDETLALMQLCFVRVQSNISRHVLSLAVY